MSNFIDDAQADAIRAVFRDALGDAAAQRHLKTYFETADLLDKGIENGKAISDSRRALLRRNLRMVEESVDALIIAKAVEHHTSLTGSLRPSDILKVLRDVAQVIKLFT